MIGELNKMAKIKISVGNVSLEAEMLDTPTASKILEALPFEGSANVWGDEIYFDIPLNLEQEPDARADVEVGDLAYWPALTLGSTPTASQPKSSTSDR